MKILINKKTSKKMIISEIIAIVTYMILISN